MESTRAFDSVTHLMERCTLDKFVQEFCQQTGSKVRLEHRGCRTLVYVGSDNWNSPSFGASCELIGYCARMLWGMVARGTK
jgi:hypothetical protein